MVTAAPGCRTPCGLAHHAITGINLCDASSALACWSRCARHRIGNATRSGRGGPPTTITNFSTEDNSSFGLFGVNLQAGVEF